ncbi:cation-translocating P-type ATPase [Algoriphagus persicinus]|uniref:cation-translocating P-type ATPase n=1 Tax=Algoriphagus persicinus TaxID=3108754 RepID=UPI002B3AA0E6|nr:cation-translocating P-type ATPase [Algoriphagus sp. E1-3-M2]MEB2783811.1 cation-translocating P-type ATPase [Algoriphagus sp. E1-3-M2]
MKINYPIADPHTFSVDEILLALKTDSAIGISQKEAENRAKEFGSNLYKAQKQKSIVLMMLLQFKSPIVYLLLFAVAVTFFFQNYIESIAILVVILVNALIGFLMELQARNSMNALREMDVIHSKVLREGKIQEIPSENIVPGDIISLEAGDLIPGDAHLIESNQLQCDESSLTGESLPTEKNIEKLAKVTALGDQFNMVFKGTSVTNGNGKAVITGISQHTQLGTITSLVENSEEKETPLNKKIRVLSKKLIWVTLGMTTIFAITGLIQGKEWGLILETSIALAVAAFPEGLPIVATVALAYGMLLMAKRNAIVKKLSAVETLGSTNVILTDKTGTLTENKIYVDSFSFPGETVKAIIKDNVLSFVEGNIEKSEEAFQKMRLIGVLCNNAIPANGVDRDDIVGDPIEIALVNLANASGSTVVELKTHYERIGEIPFSSDTKIMGTLHKVTNGNFVAAKGSVEHLLEKCSKYQVGTIIKNLDEEARKHVLEESEKMAANGLRVLAFAYKEEAEINTADYLNSLVYVAMIAFIDPPRLDVKEAIITCRKAGIKIVMITGDHPLTALNIAKKVGLVEEDEQRTITGIDIPEMESISAEWTERILHTAVFARTTPKQKLDIVVIYQKAGNIVAMTGDGVNDAPALKKADIGIAMGLRGTQVAKEAASIVLKDDSFVSIAQAVSHGREIFQNIQKFVVYLVSCNLSEIFIVTTLGFIAPASTLLPLQILFLNMVTDVFPALALGLGKGDKTVMELPPRDPNQLIVSNKDWFTISLYAVTMTLAVIVAIIFCSQTISDDFKVVNNVAFLTLAFAQLFHVFNMSSPSSNLLVNEITKNKFIWIAILICTTLLVLAYSMPQIRLVLGLEVLSTEAWLLSILAGLIPLVLVQGCKIIKKKKRTNLSIK